MGMLGGALFVDFRLAIIGSSIGMFVESLPLPFDDNFTVPISAATAMFIMSLIL
jgi:dolichol kinase